MNTERRAVSPGTGSNRRPQRLTLLLLAAAIGCSGGSSGSRAPGSHTLQSIALTPGDVTVAAGGQQQLAVTGTYSDATTAEITAGIDWSSSNPSVAALNGTGLVVATNDPTRAGTTTVTASVGGLSAQASVTVTPPALLSVTVEPASATVVEATVQGFVAVGHYAGGASAPLATVTWSSSDLGVVSLDDSFAKGMHSGDATITATDVVSGKSGTASVVVVHPTLESIAVAPASASVPAALFRKFTAVGHFSNGTSEDKVSVTWTSSNEAAATIDANGLAHGVAPGTTTITASKSGKTSTATLTVTEPVPVAEIPGGVPTDPAQLPATGAYPFKVTGLDPAKEYLVRATSTDSTPADQRPSLEVYPDSSFAGDWTCSSWAGGPPCRAGVPNAAGELFVLVTGSEHATYSLDVKPLPVLTAIDSTLTATTDTETYAKITGLTPLAAIPSTLAPAHPAADMHVYDRAGGPFGFVVGTYPPIAVPGFLCSTALAVGTVKSCPGTAPAGGEVYATVEAWMTPTGTSFTLTR